MTLRLWLKYPSAQIWGHVMASTFGAEESAADWKTPRIEKIDSGLVGAATLTTHMANVAQQSGVRASPVQVRNMANFKQRGRAFKRMATSTAPSAASHLAPAQGFHGRGRYVGIMAG